MSGYVDHGHRHLPGGTDPIRFAQPYPVWPTIQAWSGISFYNHMANVLDVDIDNDALHNSYATFNETFDPDYPGDPYDVDHGYWILPAVMGKFDGISGTPMDTDANPGVDAGLYQLMVVFSTGPDHGIVNVDVASATINGKLTSVYDENLIWVPIIDDHDLYAASPTWGSPYHSTSANFQSRSWTLTGDVGDQATSFTGGGQTLNGGAGEYYFRIRRVGKNASSSGYEVRVAEFSLGLTHVGG